jgi:hypothetical protein
VTPPHERPAIHAVGDQPRRRTLDALDGDGIVAEQSHEAVALGWRGVAAGEEEEREEWRPLHLIPLRKVCGPAGLRDGRCCDHRD